MNKQPDVPPRELKEAFEACRGFFYAGIHYSADLQREALQSIFEVAALHPNKETPLEISPEDRKVFLITSGAVMTLGHSTSGRSQGLIMHQAGEVAGSSTVLTNQAEHVASMLVKCTKATTIHSVGANKLYRLMQENPLVAVFMAHQQSQDVIKMQTQYMLVTKSATQRVLICLLQNAKPNALGLDYLEIYPKLTQQVWADMAFTSRETVSRILTQLRKKEIVTSRGGALYIHNPDAIKNWIDEIEDKKARPKRKNHSAAPRAANG